MKIPSYEDSSTSEIVESLSVKAEGMFLWARIVLDNLLTATSPAQMKEMLHKCLPGLSAVYGHFMDGLRQLPLHRQYLAQDILRGLAVQQGH